MKSKFTNVLFPIGRLVQEALYTPRTTDQDGKPILFKRGAKAGQPASQYFLNVAIKKGKEKHWKETEWGKKIWNFAEENAQPGIVNRLDFAWKIVDGDSTEKNSKEKRPCDLEGAPGNWLVKFNTYVAPQIVNNKGEQLPQVGFIRLGYFVQVYASIGYNNPEGSSMVKSGIFINPEIVSFQAYGEEIIRRVDPSEVEFGGALPKGASLTPISSSSFTEPDEEEEFPEPPAPPAPPVPPSVSRKVELGGHTWELSAMLKKGWTEAALESAGYTFL